MTFLEIDLSLLFVVAVILIWFMIAYQFVLTVFGYINYVKSLGRKRVIDGISFDYPTCTILIPAHNEEKVIGATIASMLRLEYPEEKLSVLVINDGSTDSTRDIILEASYRDGRVRLFDVPAGEGGEGENPRAQPRDVGGEERGHRHL